MTDLIWMVIGVVAALAIVWFFVHLKRRQDVLERNFQNVYACRNSTDVPNVRGWVVWC